MSSDYLHCFPDPLPLEVMFYDWGKNPEKPDWIAVLKQNRGGGTSTIMPACLALITQQSLAAPFLPAAWVMQASVASAKNEGKPAVNLDDVFAQELKKQVCNPDWKYSLPNSADIPDCTDELFGTDYGAGSHTLEEARTASTVLESKLMPWQIRRRGTFWVYIAARISCDLQCSQS